MVWCDDVWCGGFVGVGGGGVLGGGEKEKEKEEGGGGREERGGGSDLMESVVRFCLKKNRERFGYLRHLFTFCPVLSCPILS